MLVKKYSNRRLYDTEGSCYITLEELAEKIRLGSEARVVDAKTNEDLTQLTLTQIIIESRGAARLLPVPLLTQLIRMGDDSLAEFLGRYMSTALELYLQAKHGAQAIAPYNPLANVPFAVTNALARLIVGGLGLGGPPPSTAPSPAAYAGWAEPSPAVPAAPAAPANTDVADLRRELEALKASMKENTDAAARRRRRGA